jgi:hypothetical protein
MEKVHRIRLRRIDTYFKHVSDSLILGSDPVPNDLLCDLCDRGDYATLDENESSPSKVGSRGYLKGKCAKQAYSSCQSELSCASIYE